MTTTIERLPHIAPTTPARSGRHFDPILTGLAPAAWGLTYIVTTELLPPDRPLFAATLRALPAGLVLAAMARHRPTGSWWWKAGVLGVLNIGAFFVLLFIAAYRLPGGVAATLGSIQPLIAAGLATLVLGERFRRTTALAGVLGITGVGLLVLRSGAALDTVGIAAGLAGAAAMATGVVLTKYWGRPVPLAAFTGWQLIAGGLLLAPIALAVEGPPPPLTGQNLIGFTWLATGGAAISYLLWFRGVARLPVAHVSLLGLISPVVATTAGLVVLGQTLTPAQLLGAALVLSAIWIGQRPTTAPPGRPTITPTTNNKGETVMKTQRHPHHAERTDTSSAPRSRLATARTAGILYMVIIVCGLFAEIGVRSRLIESGDPAATAQNIIDAPMLFRAGLAADIIMFLADVAIAVVLYQLLRPLSRTLAMLAAAFRMTQTAVIGLNLLNMLQAVRILDDVDYLGSFGTDQTDTLALLYLEAHKYGYILGLAFFGVSTIIIGYLALSSRMIPRPLALLLVLAGTGYLVDTFSFFLIPGYDGSASPIVLAPALIAEIWFALWLLTRGQRLDQLAQHVPTAPARARGGELIRATA